MLRHYLTNILFSLITCCLLANATHASSSTTTLLVLGDSISAEYGLQTGDGWVALLAKQNPQLHLVNASISGETTAGGLSRLPRLLEEHQPALVIIELGANDGLRGHPIQYMRSNLSQLIELSQKAGAQVLLAGMHIPPNYGKRYALLFHSSYKKVADKHQVALLPFLLEGIATKPELMQRDGLHPNQKAQSLILQNVLPYLNTIAPSAN